MDNEILIVGDKKLSLTASEGESVEIALGDSRQVDLALRRLDALDPQRTARPREASLGRAASHLV